MKYIIFTFLICIINQVIAQDEASIITSFKSKLRQIDSIFSSSPIVSASQNYTDSKSGKIHYLIKIEKISISYDIQKSNSLLAPYLGYVTITIRVSDNQNYGDVKGYKEMTGFSDSEKAKEVLTFNPCGEKDFDTDEWCKGNITVTYAYEEGTWVFKSVDPDKIDKIKNGSVRGDISRGILNNLLK